MPSPSPLTTLRLPSAIRRHLDVATAAAQEALVDAHAEEALRLVAFVAEHWSFDEAINYYFDELSITGQLAASIRTRALVRLEEERRLDTSRKSMHRAAESEPAPDEADRSVWDRIRPDHIVRDIKASRARQDELERLAQLILAQAEEAILGVHVDNALDFAALLDEEMAPDRAVSYYVDSIGVSGCRAQAVVQRSMVRIADATLQPHDAPRGGVTRR